MNNTPIYRVGLGENEVSREALEKSGLKFSIVQPREKIISLAESFLGVPYKFGSSVLRDSPNSFDCSSFTAYLYVEAGFAIPRICNDQYRFGQEVSEAEAKPGDLVFFKSNRTDIGPEVIGHNGLYIGNGEMIHAGGVSMGYGKVVKERITESKYYPTGFKGYWRLIPDEAERFVVQIPEDRIDLRNKENLIKEINK
jgi:cell wall-associated NlpC family hydrolase